MAARLCQVLTAAPQGFASAEVKVAESREALDVGHSDAAFLLLDCRDDKGAQSPPRYIHTSMYTLILWGSDAK